MHHRCSLLLELEEYNPKIERFLSKIRAKKRKSKKKVVQEQTLSPKQLKEYFTPITYDLPIRTPMPTVIGPFEIKYSLI